MADRKAAYDNCKKYDVGDAVNDEERNKLYRETSKKVKSLICKSKKAVLVESFNEATTMRAKWNVIKSEGCCKDGSGIDNAEILNNFDLNVFNNHFASIHTSDGADLDNINTANNISSNFSFHEVTIDEFLNAVYKNKSNAIGDDGIPPKFLNLVMPLIADKVLYIFNYCFRNSEYPTDWNKVIIKPLNKISSPQSVTDFLPISICVPFAKIFRSLANDQIVKYLEGNHLLHDRQSGFRKNHSCTTTLLNVSEGIRSSLNKNKIVLYLSLDIKSVYPSVPHDAFFKVCELNGFDENSLKLIKSIFSNISQKVKVGASESNSVNINCGFLQGSNDGQTGFSMVINEALNVFEYLIGDLFADD